MRKEAIKLWPEDPVAAGFSTRLGGVSLPPYDSLNLGLHVGDRPEAVVENRTRLSRILGLSLDDWVVLQQVHGDHVAVVDQTHRGRGARSIHDALPGYDAAVTNVPHVVLTAQAADCVPVLFYDPVTRSVGAAHAGWKGTQLGIVRRVVELMAAEYGANPRDIQVVLGPSIGPCCYEVDERVFTPFHSVFQEDTTHLFTEISPGKWHLDLWRANTFHLLSSGCNEDHITQLRMCTACDTGRFFSHRKEAGRTGRLTGLISLI